jgi:hypothetical protein
MPEMKLTTIVDLGEFDLVDVSFKHNMIISSKASEIKMTDLKTGKDLYRYVIMNNDDYLYMTPENYYFGAKNTIKSLSFKINGKLFPFEQFDLKYNRPDIVLSRLGYADNSLIAAYRRAYLKRLKKMGFKEEDLSDDFHIPETEIKNFEYLPVITDSAGVGLNLHFEDSKYKLDRINIWINDVAVYGTNGIDLRAENTNNIDKDIKL